MPKKMPQRKRLEQILQEVGERRVVNEVTWWGHWMLLVQDQKDYLRTRVSVSAELGVAESGQA